MNIREALEAVINESNNPYAKTYAEAGLTLGDCNQHLIVTTEQPASVLILHKPTGQMMIGEEMRVQILYVLSNLACWRGERAREVKAFLKEAVKQGR
jgi:hypothetical protein